jgi:hypothetical protein
MPALIRRVQANLSYLLRQGQVARQAPAEGAAETRRWFKTVFWMQLAE